MKLTPLDLQQQVFRKTMRGYDPKQIEEFLDLVRAEWEILIRENQGLKDEMGKLERRIHEHLEKERMLQDTLMTAQRMSEDLKQTAKKEAEIVISQAELQGDRILHQAHKRLTEVIDEINELKRERAEFEGRLRGILESHQRLLDLQKEGRETSNLEDVSVISSAS